MKYITQSLKAREIPKGRLTDAKPKKKKSQRHMIEWLTVKRVLRGTFVAISMLENMTEIKHTAQ